MLRTLVLAGTTVACTGAFADIVTLRSTDGTINLQGDLIAVVDDYYLLQTPLGDLRVATNRVRCEGASCPTTKTVEADTILTGSDTIAEGLMPLLMGGYATVQDAEATVTTTANAGEFAATLVGQQGFGDNLGTYLVSSSSATQAFASLMDNSAQIALSAREISTDEAAILAAAGAGDMTAPAQEHILALDGLVLVVNPANPVSQLSVADVARIYRGEVTNWAQVGGPNMEIAVVTSDADTATVFNAGIFEGNAPANGPSAFTATDNIEASNFVSTNTNAIAYVGFAFKRGQKPLTLISECGIGTTPDAFSVKTEEYTLFRRLFLYNRGDLADPLARDFIAYANTDAANPVISQSGFINLGVERVAMGLATPRARLVLESGTDAGEQRVANDMLGLMANSDRLSSTFRFRTGSAILDPRGRADLDRLANYLADQPQGTKITFVGFADSVGAFGPNLVLAQGRAEQVRAALEAVAGDRLGHVSFAATGFGEISPAACNTTDAGRQINRRVETWISTQ
ncbi:phosphate ABC transporter substrate-binding/OmpA family protein [Yoonia tamlensis]|uniref:phosphate ABC transporter substrate-binding/OmpA family protein n=1 Tax=Yoonia tamlensis TaxID=390270 RepID=UPI0013F4DA12|nr:phosphate ABC transporter substrate-binding/OmpA family protein [Yoonia tamlensis]